MLAVPGSCVADLCPKLTPTERGYFESVRYVSGAIVHLMLERRPAGLPYYGVAFPRPERVDLYGLAVDHHKNGVAPAGAGLLNAALTASVDGYGHEPAVIREIEQLTAVPRPHRGPAGNTGGRAPQEYSASGGQRKR